MRERRQVHRILHHAMLQVLAYLHRDLDADSLLRLGSRAGYVRRENDVFKFCIWRILRWLLTKDIERRAANLAALQPSDEGRILNELAACAVDDVNALLHRRDQGFIDDPRCLRSQTHMQRQVIRILEELFDRNQLDARLARNRGGDERIVPDQLHAKAPRALRDLQANPAEAENAESLVAQL